MAMTAEHDDTDCRAGAAQGDVALVILRQGELYLEGQLRMALATQGRAATLTSVFLPSATALAGVALASWESLGGTPFWWAAVVSATFLLVGALGCLIAVILPSALHVPGSEPTNLLEALRAGSVQEVLTFEAENYQEMANRNKRMVRRYVYWLRVGGFTAISAPIAGVLIWAGLSFAQVCPG